MKLRVTVITVCVDDLEKSVRFYEKGLGLKTEGIIGKEFEHGAVAFFELQAGLKLAIWPRKSLAHDSGLPLGNPFLNSNHVRNCSFPLLRNALS